MLDLPFPSADALVAIEYDGLDITIRLRPMGFMATNPDLFWQAPAVFGLWLLASNALLAGGPGHAAFFFIVMLPLLAVPATWFLLSVHRAIQQGVIDLVGNRLVISRYGIFGLEQDEWLVNRIRAIRVVPMPSASRGSEVELQLETVRGVQHHLFAGRDPAELQWLADTLTQLISLDAGDAT